MSAPSRKRKATSPTYSSPAYLRQKRFRPQEKSIANQRLLDTIQTRQQTLTQIDFFLPPGSSDEEHETDLEEDVQKTPKRRKVIPYKDRPSRPPSKSEAASTSKVKLEGTGNVRSQDTRIHSTALLKTPTKPRRYEVPSSQSPADTPPSTRKSPQQRTPMRPPLKEKSTNHSVQKPINGSRRTTKIVPKLEIKSTYSWENEDTQISSCSSNINSRKSRTEIDEHHSFSCYKPHAKCCTATPKAMTQKIRNEIRPATPASSKHNGPIKWEIKDSEDEDESEDDEDELSNEERKLEVSHHSIWDFSQHSPRERAENEEVTQVKQETHDVIKFSNKHGNSATTIEENLSVSQGPDRRSPFNSNKHTLQASDNTLPTQHREQYGSGYMPGLPAILSQESHWAHSNNKGFSQHNPSQTQDIPEGNLSEENYRPSQASTVDITQPSPHPSSSFSPPPIPASSPLRINSECHWAEPKIDSGLWTVSQLLPDSLQMDSLIPPPPPTFTDDSDTE